MDFALVRFAVLVGVNGGDHDSRRYQHPLRMAKTLMQTNVGEFSTPIISVRPLEHSR